MYTSAEFIFKMLKFATQFPTVLGLLHSWNASSTYGCVQALPLGVTLQSDRNSPSCPKYEDLVNNSFEECDALCHVHNRKGCAQYSHSKTDPALPDEAACQYGSETFECTWVPTGGSKDPQGECSYNPSYPSRMCQKDYCPKQEDIPRAKDCNNWCEKLRSETECTKKRTCTYDTFLFNCTWVKSEGKCSFAQDYADNPAASICKS